MVLSAASAFALPRRIVDLGHTPFATLLIPVSRPTYKIANAIRNHFEPPVSEDDRPLKEIQDENLALKQELGRMSSEIDRLQQRAGERANLDKFETFCQRFEVTGTDGDNRDGLIIAGTNMGDVR